MCAQCGSCVWDLGGSRPRAPTQCQHARGRVVDAGTNRIRLIVGTSRSRNHSHWFVHGGTASSELEIIAHARDGSEVIRKAAELHPEAVLVDTEISGIDALGLSTSFGERDADARAVLFCLHDPGTSDSSPRVLATACTYILNSADLTDVAQVIQRVHARNCPHAAAPARKKPFPTDVALTDREMQVLRYVVRAMTSREIGEHLRISPRTVDAHRSNVMKKLGIHTVAGLVRYAYEHQVFDSESTS